MSGWRQERDSFVQRPQRAYFGTQEKEEKDEFLPRPIQPSTLGRDNWKGVLSMGKGHGVRGIKRRPDKEELCGETFAFLNGRVFNNPHHPLEMPETTSLSLMGVDSE